MERYQIILLIALLTLFVYLSLFLFVFSHTLEFNNRLNKKLRALNVLLSEKANCLRNIDDDFHAMALSYGNGDIEAVKALKTLRFEKATFDNVKSNQSIVKSANSHLSYLASKNRWAQKSKTYLDNVAMLEDLDRNYRQCLGLYLSDLTAYNYWLTVPGTRLFMWVFGFRKRGMLD